MASLREAPLFLSSIVGLSFPAPSYPNGTEGLKSHTVIVTLSGLLSSIVRLKVCVCVCVCVCVGGGSYMIVHCTPQIGHTIADLE